jgi:hypothetical protein
VLTLTAFCAKGQTNSRKDIKPEKDIGHWSFSIFHLSLVFAAEREQGPKAKSQRPLSATGTKADFPGPSPKVTNEKWKMTDDQ